MPRLLGGIFYFNVVVFYHIVFYYMPFPVTTVRMV